MCGQRRRDGQRRGQYLGDVRVSVQNLATCLARKGRSSRRVSWGLEGRDTKTSADHDHTWTANKPEGKTRVPGIQCFTYVGQEEGKLQGEAAMTGR